MHENVFEDGVVGVNRCDGDRKVPDGVRRPIDRIRALRQATLAEMNAPPSTDRYTERAISLRLPCALGA